MKLRILIFPFIILVLFLEGLAVGHQINTKKQTKTIVTNKVCNRTTHKCKEAKYGKRD